MKNTNEMQLEKMLDCLYSAGLTEEQAEKAESYFTGESESFEIKAEEKRQIDLLQRDAKDKLKKQLDRTMKINGEAYGKLFKVVFEVFGSSIKELFYHYDFIQTIKNDEKRKYMPKPEAMVVCAELGGAGYYINREDFYDIIRIAENDDSVWDQALKLSDTKTVNARLMICTAYFISKKSIENKTLFEEYVNTIIYNIKNLFVKTITVKELGALESFINGDADIERSQQICDILNNRGVYEDNFKLLVSCAAPNYEFSPKLCNFLKICAYGKNFNKAMDFIKRTNPSKSTSELKKELQLEPVDYIKWCGENKRYNTLREEALADKESFSKAIEQANINTYQTLVSIVKKIKDEKYSEYYKEVLDSQIGNSQEKLINEFLSYNDSTSTGIQIKAMIRSYLLGQGKADDIYEHKSELNKSYYYRLKTMIDDYEFTYGKDKFRKRCMTLVAIVGTYYIVLDGFSKKENYVQFMTNIFDDFTETGLSFTNQLDIAVGMYRSVYHTGSHEAYVQIFSKYLQESEAEVLAAFRNAEAEGRMIGVCTLANAGEKYKNELLGYFADTSKAVKEKLIEAMTNHEEWAEDVLEKLNSKKASEREMAISIIRGFKGDYSEKLSQALEKEKSKKLADLIRNILGMEAVKEEKQEILGAEGYVKEIHKGNKKRGLSWAYETPFSVVHFADSTEEASEEYMQAVLLSYSTMYLPGYNKEVFLITDKLNKNELAVYVNELFDKWLEAGAQAKQKWVLYVSAIHGGHAIVDRLKHEIDEWAKNARGAIASDAVKAMALNDSPTALLVVDGIARKYKHKQVRTAAGLALENAAKELGLTTEELADKIVPDLGFNENMERIFDYGERKFKVYITSALEIEVYDENDKKLKNIPAPGKKDDEVKAAEAYTEFKQMKKQMKTTIATQKQRLELALSIERKWKADKWQELFVKNPIMHQFAISLIWGVYENGQLKDTFRYMEDGTFNTVDEDEYELDENATIGLVHPIELDEEIRKQWNEQLADYEITQSIEQLKRPVYMVTDEEKNMKVLERFGGMVLNGYSLSGKLMPMGWNRGAALDGGVYVVFIKEDKECDMGVALHFSGVSMGYENEDVTVYGAHFYRPSTAKKKDFSYDFIKDEEAASLGEVSPRYFSEIVYQLTKATASSQEIDESWRYEFERR